MSLKYEDRPDPDTDPHPLLHWKKLTKIVVLLVLWSFFTFYVIGAPFDIRTRSVVIVEPNKTTVRQLVLPIGATKIVLRGPIDAQLQMFPGNAKNASMVGVRVEWRNSELTETIKRTAMWNVYVRDEYKFVMTSRLFVIGMQERKDVQAVVSLEGKCAFPVALLMQTDSTPIVSDYRLLYAVLLLIGLNVIIMFELTDPTLAALLMATTGVATLGALGDRPNLNTLMTWVDFKMIMLLFGLMIIVGITSEAGILDWLAIQTYRISMGHPWLVIILLGMFTAAMSSVLNNVTVVILMAPIAVQLSEAMHVQTSLFILVVVMYSNLGGATTPVGDPPNMVIVSRAEVDSFNFIAHMLPGVLVALLLSLPVIYLTMRRTLYQLTERQMRMAEAYQASRYRLTAEVAERAAWLREHQSKKSYIKPVDNYFETLADMQVHSASLNRPLLVKSLITVIYIVGCFPFHSRASVPGASLAATSILGAFLLIILAKLDGMESVFRHVDWSALLFLAAHFVFASVIYELGLVDWMSDYVVEVISSVQEDQQTMVAIVLVVWLTAFLTAFVNNMVTTDMLLRLITHVSQNNSILVPLSPLIWALAFGACFGANGTLMGSHANLIGMMVGRRFGYRITFTKFFRYGFPMMIVSLSVATAYLLITHKVYTWH